MEAAAQTVSAIIAARIIPCTLEFLDQMTIRCVDDFTKMGLPTDCAALLLMETDGHPAAVADEAEKMAQIANDNGALELTTAANEAESLKLASARRSAFSALARVSPTTILEDVTVPRSHLAEIGHVHRQDRRRPQSNSRHLRPHGRWQPPPHFPNRRTRQSRDGKSSDEALDLHRH